MVCMRVHAHVGSCMHIRVWCVAAMLELRVCVFTGCGGRTKGSGRRGRVPMSGRTLS